MVSPRSSAGSADAPSSAAGSSSRGDRALQPLHSLEEIRRLTDIGNVIQALRLVSEYETQVDADLDRLLESRPELEAPLGVLDKQRPQLESLWGGCSKLFENIARTSRLAESISVKVRQLDLEQSRVKEAINIVEDIQELKKCVSGVEKAIKDRDYEAAAEHVHRSKKLDRRVVEGSLADYALPASRNSKNAGELLAEAQQTLSDVITQEFEKAAQAGDQEGIRRYMKLFPLIGKTTASLDQYARHVCGLVSDEVQKNMRGPSNVPLFFTGLLIKLFEHLASIIDNVVPKVIDECYGPGYALRVHERLQEECDRQAKLIIDTFMDDRHIMRKLYEIKNYDSTRRSPQRNPKDPEAVVDPRDLDLILTEITKMRQHVHIFERFSQSRAKPHMEYLREKGLVTEVVLPVEPGKYDENGLPKVSGMAKTLRELMALYLTMEDFFIRRSIEKAMRIDNYEPGNATSNCVDDTFYIVKKSSERALSTSDAATVIGVNSLLSRALDVDYISVFQKKFGTVIAGSDTRDSRIGYMILLNNINVSCDYLMKLAEEGQCEVDRLFKNVPDATRDRIQASFGLLTEAADRFQRILKTALEQFFNHTIRNKLRPLLMESMQSGKYVLNETTYAEQERSNGFAQRMNTGFGRLVELSRATLTGANYDQLMALALDCTSKEWEKLVLQAKFNQLGALRFDKDFRSVSLHLSSLTQWPSRDRFARLQQISTLLNLEELSEIYEYRGPKAVANINWQLTVPEIRKVLSLRTEFPVEEIAKLAL